MAGHTFTDRHTFLSIVYLLYVCTGVLNALLSWKALVPLSKLTYCAFLVHFVIQDIHAFSTRTSITLDFLNLVSLVE